MSTVGNDIKFKIMFAYAVTYIPLLMAFMLFWFRKRSFFITKSISMISIILLESFYGFIFWNLNAIKSLS